MDIIKTKDAPQAIGPYSQAILHNDIIYTSGQIALTADGSLVEGGIQEQTRQVLENLKAVLQAAGSDLNSVIKTTVFLADMGDFLKLNAIYAEYFLHHKPARSTVAVKSLPKEVLVEIECIAVCKRAKEYSY